MKKFLIYVLLLLLLPAVSLAQEAPLAPATANGIVEAVNTYDIVAPFSGTLLPFVLHLGDEVAASQPLFALDTTKIYAPESGLFTLFASEGDSAENVCRQYGMLGSIEKTNRYIIECTYRNAYDDMENKFVSVGEQLYFKLAEDYDEKGEGRVVAASPRGYTVEIKENDYEIGKRAKMYREEKRNSNSCVGEGLIARAVEQQVLGSGRVLRCVVADGQMVRKGDLLFETVAADADPSAVASVVAPRGGVLGALPVLSGQQVYKGQLLVTLHDPTAMKVVAEVDEVDLPRLTVGSGVSLEFDSFPGQQVSGTVTRIASMGIAKQNATYYNVDIAFISQLDVRLLMNATVTLP